MRRACDRSCDWLALNPDRMRNSEEVTEVWIDTGDVAPSEVGNELRRRSQFPLSLIAQDRLLRDAAVDPLISSVRKISPPRVMRMGQD